MKFYFIIQKHSLDKKKLIHNFSFSLLLIFRNIFIIIVFEKKINLTIESHDNKINNNNILIINIITVII